MNEEQSDEPQARLLLEVSARWGRSPGDRLAPRWARLRGPRFGGRPRTPRGHEQRV